MSGSHGSRVRESDPLRPRLFWPAFVAGAAVMAYGVSVALDTARLTRPGQLLVWILGAVVLHDAVLVPLVLLAGALVHRTLGGPFRRALQSGLVATGVLVALTLPLAAGERNPTNPEILSRPYGAAFLVALAVVWSAVTLALVVGVRRRWREIAAAEAAARDEAPPWRTRGSPR